MRSWERFVADRLARARLPREIQDDVITEIAAHLEECEDELRAAGDADPRGGALGQVQDWRAFGRRIRRSKESDMKSLRRIMLPGVAAAIASIASLKLFVYLLITPTECAPDTTCILVSADGPAYLPWLATLPLAGALGAALARFQDATPRQRLVASIFPALYLAADILGLAVFAAFYWRVPVYWVLIPAIACALGAWPLLGGRARGFAGPPVAAAAEP